MRVIIFDCANTEEIVNHFIAYGFDSFVIFGKNITKAALKYYSLNGIEIIMLNSMQNQSTKEKLTNIKGSLNESFIIAYSCSVCDFDLDKIKKYHRKGQCTATAVQSQKKLCALMCDCEIFDFFDNTVSFEADVILKLGENNELNIYQ